MMRWRPFAVGSWLLASVSCAPASVHVAGDSVVSSAAVWSTSSFAPVEGRGRGYAFMVAASACWLDGLWSNALDERGDAGNVRRCAAVLEGAQRPHDELDKLRALDVLVVDAVVRQLWRLALEDEIDAPHARPLVSLLTATANAAREGVRARRAVAEPAGDASQRQLLGTASDLSALVRLGGPYAEEARALGILFALDRMELARDLAGRAKVDAVKEPLAAVFDVPPPRADGKWEDYLATAAKKVGHPVAAGVKNREDVAWNGVLVGFADALRATPDHSEVGRVAHLVAAHVESR